MTGGAGGQAGARAGATGGAARGAGPGAEVVLATANAHKIAELERILGGTGIRVLPLTAFPGPPEVAETGTTFAANALLKARAIAGFTGLPSVADDSGLCVDALNGMPGVLSARWAGRHGDDEANLRLLLAQLADVPDERRGARFRCAAALALPGGPDRVTEGVLAGRIIREPRGGNGFGYDPIFVPDGERRTTAELSPEAKDAISHRGRAFRALTPAIVSLAAAG